MTANAITWSHTTTRRDLTFGPVRLWAMMMLGLLAAGAAHVLNLSATISGVLGLCWLGQMFSPLFLNARQVISKLSLTDDMVIIQDFRNRSPNEARAIFMNGIDKIAAVSRRLSIVKKNGTIDGTMVAPDPHVALREIRSRMDTLAAAGPA